MVKVESKKDNETYYSKLKSENEELKSKTEWLDQESWLLAKDVKIEQVYNYLKRSPKSAEFIYQKYTMHQPVIMELCNPKNPLYLKDVANELKDLIVIENEEDKLKKIEEDKKAGLEELRKYTDEINKLENEIKEKEKKWEDTEKTLLEITKQKEDIDREMGNLKEPEVIKKIKSFNESFMVLIKSIFNNKNDKDDFTERSLGIVKLTADQKNTLKLLSEQAETILKEITDEDFLSDYKFNEIRENLKKQIEEAKESAEKEMNAFTLHNPQKVLKSIGNHINDTLKLFDRGDTDISGLKYFNRTGQGRINGELGEAKNEIEMLSSQVENKSRWSKLKLKGE